MSFGDLPPDIPAPGEVPTEEQFNNLSKLIADRARRSIDGGWVNTASTVVTPNNERVTFSVPAEKVQLSDGPITRYFATVTTVLPEIRMDQDGLPLQRELSWGVAVEDSATHQLGMEPDYDLHVTDNWVPANGAGVVSPSVRLKYQQSNATNPPVNQPSAEQFFILQKATQFSNAHENRPPMPRID